jgi:uncharacterized protein (TIGR03905 family)
MRAADNVEVKHRGERDMKYTYRPAGVCSTALQFEIVDGAVRNVGFLGGCDGNSKGLAVLVEGMPVDEVIRKLSGIGCEAKPTSCPDQLAAALREARGKPGS